MSHPAPATPAARAVARPDIAPDTLPALLRDFYGRAFADELLGPVFVDIARMDLERHLPVIGEFWSTVLFGTQQYRRNALQPHLRLHRRAGLTPDHFERWLELWTGTLDDRHAGPVAELARVQATRIASAMTRRVTGIASDRIDAQLVRTPGRGRARPGEPAQTDPAATTLTPKDAR